MALEQPFTHWPFSTSNNGRQGNQNSQRFNDRFKRYDTNDSPFKDISPIPVGREFGTFPVRDRQPRNVAREELTQKLNIRASQGFLAPEELETENLFLPIPEDEGSPRDIPVHHAEPPFTQDHLSHQVHPSHQVRPPPVLEQEPMRGLSLMDRYRDLNQETRPVRRTNSLVEFAEFIGRVGDQPTNRREESPPRHVPSPQQRRRQQPVMTEQQSLKRSGVPKQRHPQQTHPLQNGNSHRQPNGGLIGSQQYSSNRRQPNGGLKINQQNGHTQLNGVQQPRAVPTLIPSYPTAQPINHQPPDDYPYLPRKPRRRRQKKKKKNILCCGIGMVVTGFLVLCGFIAAFVAITLLKNAWPDSGLLLAGVVFGFLVTVVGFIFACHRCYSMEYDNDLQPAPVIDDKTADMHPVWQTSLPRSGLEAIPMTDLPLVQDEYTGHTALEPEIMDGDLGHRIPNGSGPFTSQTALEPEIMDRDLGHRIPNGSGLPVANGVPTPLAFTTPFSTSPNDYHLY